MEPHRYAKIKYRSEEGFSALFIVIILGGVALALAMWFSTSSVWSIRESRYSKEANQARVLADTCAEMALEDVRENKTISQTGNESFGGGTCSWMIGGTGDDSRQITARGVVGDTVSQLEIQTKNFNPVEIISWQEN
jgi:hypothetical protein